MIIKYVIPLFALTLVIALHELGHLIAGKLFGVKVEVFSIGIGKKIFKKDIKGTEFAISLLPFGGYCKLKGGDIDNPSLETDSMDRLHPLKRVVIYLMGPVFNILLTLLLLTTVYQLPVHQELPNTVLPITGENYPAEQAGLKKGDKIVQISGNSIERYSDISKNITDSNIEVVVERDGIKKIFQLEPQNSSGYFIGVYPYIPLKIHRYNGTKKITTGSTIYRVGSTEVDNVIELQEIIKERESFQIFFKNENSTYTLELQREDINDMIFIEFESYNFLDSLYMGFSSVYTMTYKILDLFGSLFKDGKVSETLSTPLRLIYEVGNSVESIYKSSSLLITFYSFISIMASISLTLGIINLFPIPVLDGGQIVINIVTAIKGSPLNKKIIYTYQTLGLVMILLLFSLGLSNDIFFFGEIK